MDANIQTDSPEVMKLLIAWQAARTATADIPDGEAKFKALLEKFAEAYKAIIEVATGQPLRRGYLPELDK
ncbi:MAG: hypothetical protein WBW48_04165 [Anaerolineae bacterium]